jgi:hypothetical protein
MDSTKSTAKFGSQSIDHISGTLSDIPRLLRFIDNQEL